MARSNLEIIRAAKRRLQRDFVKGDWVRYKDNFSWSPDDSLSLLSKRIKEKPNEKCIVCAEGAIYFECALDEDEGVYRARDIIDEINRINSVSILEINDDKGKEAVLKVFAQTEKELSRQK